MSLGRSGVEEHIYDAAIEGGYVTLGWGGEVDWSEKRFEEFNEVKERWREVESDASGKHGNIAQTWAFRNMAPGDIVIVSDGNLKFRAIGEVFGGYEFKKRDIEWNHSRPVKWLKVLEDSLPVELIYEDRFSMASCYRLSKTKMKVDALATLLERGEVAAENPTRYLLIIDEINRSNISKIFGELITLLEADKRLGAVNALTATLPYSGDQIGVPNNLYIIGTMNTADRSIALLDTAIRRRFRFVEMMPNYDVIDRDVEGINLKALLQAINARIEWLLDRDHQIGHSYFIDVRNKAALDEVMKYSVIPLLAEYFYDDWKKLKAILNEENNSTACFIEVRQLETPKSMEDEFEDRFSYCIATEFPIEAYKNVCNSN